MQKLLEILRDIKDDVDFERETALVDDGLIDSLDLTQIIAALDRAYGVRITAADIEPENFNSAEAMLAMIRRHQAQA
ncbi:MAG TPA: acyl carrier protein [Candidatus Limiplasma stercoravium]|nr:acyl carrier protein [Candidatus Limiplasma stercoravium]